MTHPASGNDSHHPALTAEELGKRFLKLIEGLDSRNDLSQERVQQVMGITLKHFKGTPDYRFSFSQPLEEGWYAAVRYITGSPSLQRGVSLSFDKPGEWHSRMPAAVCVLDFHYYHEALVAMGFLAEPYYGEIGELRSWRYTKFKKTDGTVDMTLSIIPQNIVPGEVGRLCVTSIGTLNGR